jgi:hypothetical protein
MYSNTDLPIDYCQPLADIYEQQSHYHYLSTFVKKKGPLIVSLRDGLEEDDTDFSDDELSSSSFVDLLVFFLSSGDRGWKSVGEVAA